MNATITGPCGHTTDFELTCVSRDNFACCQCGREWHVIQDPPTVHPSGWVEPGKRTEIEGPSQAEVRRRASRRVPLSRVLAQAAASESFRQGMLMQ